MDESWSAAVSLSRRLPPQLYDKMVQGIAILCPDMKERFLRRVDCQMKICYDKKAQRYYIGCIYNREGAASFRSPWTNTYYLQQVCSEQHMLENFKKSISMRADKPAFKPAEHLRQLEISFNEIFNRYRSMYYEEGVSSVYLWSQPNAEGFAAAFLIHHELDESPCPKAICGSWSSIHVVEVTQSSINVIYKMTSTVIVNLKSKSRGVVNAGVVLTRTGEHFQKISEVRSNPNVAPHIGVIGPLIENTEIQMRTTVERIYFAKTHQIIDSMRVNEPIFQIMGKGFLLHLDSIVKKQERKSLDSEGKNRQSVLKPFFVPCLNLKKI